MAKASPQRGIGSSVEAAAPARGGRHSGRDSLRLNPTLKAAGAGGRAGTVSRRLLAQARAQAKRPASASLRVSGLASKPDSAPAQ
jgi:hypothetical protein